MIGEKIGEGREAEIFAWGADQALKLYRRPDRAERAGGESEVTQFLNRLGAPVPHCFGTVEVKGRHGVILERLVGPAMGDVIHGADAEATARDLAALQAEINAVDGGEFESLKEHMVERIGRAAPPAPVRLTPGPRA